MPLNHVPCLSPCVPLINARAMYVTCRAPVHNPVQRDFRLGMHRFYRH
jgi:hypothetical protein